MKNKVISCSSGTNHCSIALMLRQAEDLVNDRKFTEAEEVLDQIVNAHPLNQKALMLLGECYFRSGKYSLAIEHYKALSRKHENLRNAATHRLAVLHWILNDIKCIYFFQALKKGENLILSKNRKADDFKFITKHAKMRSKQEDRLVDIDAMLADLKTKLNQKQHIIPLIENRGKYDKKRIPRFVGVKASQLISVLRKRNPKVIDPFTQMIKKEVFDPALKLDFGRLELSALQQNQIIDQLKIIYQEKLFPEQQVFIVRNFYQNGIYHIYTQYNKDKYQLIASPEGVLITIIKFPKPVKT